MRIWYYKKIMIIRELKLKLTKKQEEKFNSYFWHLSSLYNFIIRKIELNAKDKIYFSCFDLINLLSNHAKKIGIHSQVFQQTIKQARRKQDMLNPQKYRYSMAFDDLVEDNTHIVAIVLFRYQVGQAGEPVQNNYIVTAYQKEIW